MKVNQYFDNKRIIQLQPADGYVAGFTCEDDSIYWQDVVFFALVESIHPHTGIMDTEVKAMTVVYDDPYESCEVCDYAENFYGIRKKGDEHICVETAES